MASVDYNSRPLPAPSSHGQPSQSSSYEHPQQYPLRQQQPPQQQYQQPQQQQYSQRPQPQSQSQAPERARPRSRGFSFRSDKSQKTDKSSQKGGAHNRISSTGLHETSAEKEAKRLHSKADPTLAMQEAEPSAIASAAVNFDDKPPLSSYQHKDSNGAPITDPDRSNPTRSRWERPLDTIRSFEAAIDGGYSNRQSIYRADSESVINFNRRSSYYGNSNGPRFPRDSYYGGQPGSAFRPESVMMDPRNAPMQGGPRDGYFDGPDAGVSGRNGGRNQHPRMQSDVPYSNGQPGANRNVYPGPNQRSYETVASGSGSGSLGEPAGYQTDPTSSEDSSINRRMPPKQQEPTNDYGISFGQQQTYQPPVLNQPSSQPRTMPDDSHAPPAPPPKSGGLLLRKASKTSGMTTAPRPELGEKRKSWFSRRFSKNS